jgi:hypothetical protein
VESGLLLDIIVRQGTAILQLLPGEDQSKEHQSGNRYAGASIQASLTVAGRVGYCYEALYQ